MMPEKKAIIVGISGASSSGKTTLARLLRDIFPNSFILHQDDFYRPEIELPKKDGLLDWDCAQALDVPKMAESLAHISQHGVFPPDHDSKEDRNSISSCPVPNDVIEEQKSKVQVWPGKKALENKRLCILDGFLMYSESMSQIQPYLNLKLFIRTTHARCKQRREARDGYATVEGWWVDPPGYVDKIVWPNYVQDHGFMFQDGDVEGHYRREVLDRECIKTIQEEKESNMVALLKWVVEEVMTAVEKEANEAKEAKEGSA